MLADYHMHTEFSDDSTCPMEKAIQTALAKNFDEICFTEHIDYGVKTDLNCDCQKYLEKFTYYQKLFSPQIKLKFGMEFGMQTHTINQFAKTFASYPFDFIILSCHQVDNLEFWNQAFQQGKTQQEYNELYYQEILKVIQQYKDYCVLGHLDMINRYDQKGIYPFNKVFDLVNEILKQVINDHKGIEINTSCYRYGLKDLTPSIEILKLYKKLGGDIITIGSDGHDVDQYGFKIQETKQILKALEFKYIYTFDKMKPIVHTI